MVECWTSPTCVESFLDSISLFLLPSFSLSPTLSFFLILSSNLDGTKRDREEEFFDAEDKKERGSGTFDNLKFVIDMAIDLTS